MKRTIPRCGQLLAVAILSAVSVAQAGSFLQFDDRPADQVVHPAGYLGTASTLQIRVCLDPAALPMSGDPTQSFLNAVATFNRNQAVLGNIASNPGGATDFESMLLHEIGHCIGMGHSALGPSEVGATSASRYYTNAQLGPNSQADTAPGADGRRGSRDDFRGDDINISWFRRGVNDPFALPGARVDRHTHTVDLFDLPPGHEFAEISTSLSPCAPSDANTSSLRGQPATQNVMFPVICPSHQLRALAPDDVTLLRIARSGSDGIQDSADDYSTQLTYIGETTSDCDIVVRFTAGAGFAFCAVGGIGVPGSDDIAINGAEVFFERAVGWQFNPLDSTGAGGTSSDLALSKTSLQDTVMPGDSVTFTLRIDNLGVAPMEAVTVSDPTPSGLQFVANSGACTTPFPCVLPGTLAGGASAMISSTYLVEEGLSGGMLVTNTATVGSNGLDPVPDNNADSYVLSVQAEPGADLAVTTLASTSSGVYADPVSFEITVSNLGPASAESISVDDWGAAGFTFVSNSGDCASAYPCALGSLAPGASATFTSRYTVAIEPMGAASSLLTHRVSVSAGVHDPDPDNNQAVNTLRVSGPDHLFASSFEAAGE